MKDSILLSIAKYIGLPGDYSVFDSDLIMHINSELSTLAQLGALPSIGFAISGPDETWNDLFCFSENTDELPNSRNSVQFIKEFICIRTRIIFDPPQSSFVLKALEDKANELMFRIIVATEESN